MNRRTFLLGLSGSSLVLAAGIKGVALARDYALEPWLEILNGLDLAHLQSRGAWTASEIFQHCAQSIRYSRIGYPQARSALFHHTAGTAAVNLFAASGRMTHPLDEPIPGAPVLSKTQSVAESLAELIREVEQFIDWSEPLAPHFAYGSLSKAQYTAAHSLHLQNHWLELVLGPVASEGVE